MTRNTRLGENSSYYLKNFKYIYMHIVSFYKVISLSAGAAQPGGCPCQRSRDHTSRPAAPGLRAVLHAHPAGGWSSGRLPHHRHNPQGYTQLQFQRHRGQ